MLESLIVFYSREGATEDLARELSVHLNSDILELEDNKDRSGLLGYLMSRFDALTANITVINNFDHRLEDYDLILIGTPIWAGKMTPAIRTFLLGNAEVLPDVAFFVTHEGKSARKALTGMEDLAGKEPLDSLVLDRREVRGKPGDKKSEIDTFVRSLCSKMEDIEV